MPRKRIAAIDVGTNSIHMVVAERRGRGHRIVDREKEMVQLGRSSLDGQPLTEAAIEAGVAAITRMREIATRWEVDEIVAVATSAVREAPNRDDFLRRVKEASGVDVEVISGEREADYIWRAVRSSIDIGSGTALCIDIGGGSMELIAGTSREIYFTRSEPLGALRLAQRFALEDQASPAAVEACRKHVAGRLRKIRKQVRNIGFDLCVGTSGTVLALTAMTNPGASDDTPHALQRLERSALTELTNRLTSMSARERAEAFSIEPKRAATIAAGAIVLEEVMRLLDIEGLLACPAAIREGILEARAAQRRAAETGSVRKDSVLSLAKRTDCDLRHALHVSRLALRIFDQTHELHGLGDHARELLQYAALLHETGMHVSDRAHHKHSYYLIRHADLRGFTADELLIIANTARYYRKSPPDETHPNLSELSTAHRRTVERLSAILRIAEGLDRAHRQSVRDVAVRARNRSISFTVRTRAEASVELASAARRARYFRDLFERKVHFDTP